MNWGTVPSFYHVNDRVLHLEVPRSTDGLGVAPYTAKNVGQPRKKLKYKTDAQY